MSMLDSFFNKGFRGSKCKTLLKLTIPRIKLLRNRRELQIKQMRKEIAKLLETGQEATARIRVEHIVREENMMAAQEIIELFCELISVRLPIIETQRECPLDLKEAISSVCFAAPRCADLPELLQVQLAFVSKYGKEFVAAATELMPDCGVNRQLIELLSVRAPPAEKKLKLLKEIAEEHGVDWDPVASETELFKSHEDLLDGSTQYISGNKVPLPKEKHEEVLQSVSSKVTDEQYESDSGLDSLDFPEVPTAILKPNAGSNTTDHLPSAPNTEMNQGPLAGYENLARQPSKEPEEEDLISRPPEARQFVPFITPPPLSQQPSSKDVEQSVESVERVQSETSDDPNIRMDLQDVILAAQTAAESAERAAAAARSAASLAQLRISEISSRQRNPSLDVLPDNPFDMESSILSEEKKHLDHQVSSADSDYRSNQFANESSPGAYDSNESLFKNSSNDETREQESPHQLPQRMTSMEDDLLSSYPNLFGSGGRSFTGNSRSDT